MTHPRSWSTWKVASPTPHRGHLDKGVSGPVVRDGQPQGILRHSDLHLLGLAAHMCEDKVLQPYLAAQELLHVHFVAV